MLTCRLLPVSGVYVMTAHEAAEAARRIQPRVAVPMHWGEHIGTVAEGIGLSIPVRAAVGPAADRVRALLASLRAPAGIGG